MVVVDVIVAAGWCNCCVCCYRVIYLKGLYRCDGCCCRYCCCRVILLILLLIQGDSSTGIILLFLIVVDVIIAAGWCYCWYCWYRVILLRGLYCCFDCCWRYCCCRVMILLLFLLQIDLSKGVILLSWLLLSLLLLQGEVTDVDIVAIGWFI